MEKNKPQRTTPREHKFGFEHISHYLLRIVYRISMNYVHQRDGNHVTSFHNAPFSFLEIFPTTSAHNPAKTSIGQSAKPLISRTPAILHMADQEACSLYRIGANRTAKPLSAGLQKSNPTQRCTCFPKADFPPTW